MTKLNDIFDAMRAAANGEVVQYKEPPLNEWTTVGLYVMSKCVTSREKCDQHSRLQFRIKPKTKMVPSVEMPSGYSSRGTTPYIDGPGDKIYVLQGTPTELLEYELARRALDGMKLDENATGFLVTYEAKVKWTEVEEA